MKHERVKIENPREDSEGLEEVTYRLAMEIIEQIINEIQCSPEEMAPPQSLSHHTKLVKLYLPKNVIFSSHKRMPNAVHFIHYVKSYFRLRQPI